LSGMGTSREDAAGAAASAGGASGVTVARGVAGPSPRPDPGMVRWAGRARPDWEGRRTPSMDDRRAAKPSPAGSAVGRAPPEKERRPGGPRPVVAWATGCMVDEEAGRLLLCWG